MLTRGANPYDVAKMLGDTVGRVEKFVAAGPVSRILSAVSGRTVIPLGRALLRGSSDLPGGCGAPSRHAALRNRSFSGNPSLFGLAPCGVCPARRITAAAVRSYRTFSPLPEPCGAGGMFSVALSVERSRPYKRGGSSRTLSGTLLCGVRTFLPSCDERPSGPAANNLIIVHDYRARQTLQA
jgi:hypothetical protein